jgi:hypothetical protein
MEQLLYYTLTTAQKAWIDGLLELPKKICGNRKAIVQFSHD